MNIHDIVLTPSGNVGEVTRLDPGPVEFAAVTLASGTVELHAVDRLSNHESSDSEDL